MKLPVGKIVWVWPSTSPKPVKGLIVGAEPEEYYKVLVEETVISVFGRNIWFRKKDARKPGFFSDVSVRRVVPQMFAHEIVSAQPMTMPTGLLFHLNYTYTSGSTNK